MNVLCIGFYDKFSRFFIGLKKETPNIKLKILSINLSGYLYSLLRFTSSSPIAFKAWFKVLLNKKKYLRILQNHPTYRNIYLYSCIEFHLKLNKNIKKKHLLLQAIAYIDIIRDELENFKPDALLLIGDSRLLIEVTSKIATQLNIKTYFIEQGPFNTTFFDLKGVNANASVKSFEIKEHQGLTNQQQKDIYNFINRPKALKYNRFAFYRGVDLVLKHLFSKSFLYPPDLKYTDTFPKLRITKNLKTSTDLELENTGTKVFLLILQVPMDVNMIFHSPNFKNHFDIVKKVHENLPKTSKLVLREHPVYTNKYDKELYKYCNKHNLSFDRNKSLKRSLTLADVVIVNNSTVGVEAIALKKTVLVLGNAYYDNPKICIKYNTQDNLKALLKQTLNYVPNDKNIDVFLNEFLFNHLIEGFITDKNLIVAKTISNKLKASIN